MWEEATSGSSTTTTLFVGQLEEIATTGSTTTTTKYYYVGQRRVAVRVGSTLSYLVADGLSSITEALDSGGTLTAVQLYAPYGAVRYSSGTMPTSYGFTGQRLDASGLQVMGSRFYDPVAGQFVAGDDALPGGGAILGGLNRYAYVVGNPETMTDETGHWPWDNVVAAVTNVVAAVAPAIAAVVQAAAPVVGAVANAALGISDMVNDVKTIFNPNASWQDKFGSVVNLGFNVFMDATTVIGVGEGLKTLEIGGKLAADVGEQAVKDGAEQLVKDGGEAVAKDGEQNVVKDVVKGCDSFRADTPVATPSGAQAIGTLKVGSIVLAVDGRSGKVKAEPVLHVFINHDTNLLDVTLANVTVSSATVNAAQVTTKQQGAALASHGSQAPPATETLHTTTEHPFLTKELGWVNAQDLTPGEHVRHLDGTWGVVIGTHVVAGEAVRYNLTVANEHTFVVGSGQWVVHNTCGEGDVASYEELSKKGDVGDGLEGHHIPSKKYIAQFGVDAEDGAAVAMKRGLHQLTRTYGGRMVAALNEDAGRTFLEVVQNDLEDYRNVGGPNPAQVASDIMDYWLENRPDLMGYPS